MDGHVATRLSSDCDQVEEMDSEHFCSAGRILGRFAGREVLATVAHELRCPLAAIIHALQVLEDRVGDDSTAQRIWEIVGRQTRRASRIVDDLNDVYASSCDKLALVVEVADVVEVANRAVESADHLLAGCGHFLTVSMPPRPLLVQGDSSRLEQVLINLLANASKFTGYGGHIQLTAEADSKQVVIRVRDNGRGIEPHFLPRVFDLFSQGCELKGQGGRGLGLGLTLVKSLVELHGGSVEAFSEGTGRGAEMVVHLPTWNGESQGYSVCGSPLPGNVD